MARTRSASADRGSSGRLRRLSNHVRYALMNVFLAGGIVSLAQGGAWTWFGLVFTFILLGFVDELVGDDSDANAMPHPLYLNAMLWLTLPLLLIMTLVAINVSTAGNGFIDAAMLAVGLDASLARSRMEFFSIGGAFTSLGMFYGAAGVNVGHELIHRPGAPYHNFIGRCLLAFSWDTQFAIAHVHGHHRSVGTELDPATARRGEYVLKFVVRSTVGQWRFARRFERERTSKLAWPQNWLHNRFWRGQLMTLTVVAVYCGLAGPIGLLWSAFAALVGKAYLEVTNFIEHFGLVRVPGTRIEPRHSWDSYRWLSTGVLYNLPLHSHHHQFATRPFWELKHNEGRGPVLPMGYLPMILASFIPPLWTRLSRPLLTEWDRTFASDDERALLQQRGQYLG